MKTTNLVGFGSAANRRGLILFVLAAVLSLPPAVAAAQAGLPEKPAAALGFDAARLERVPAMLRREIEAQRYAGAVWLVARDGAVVARGAVGVRDVASGQAMTEDTVFRIFSMTKIVTTVTALTLVEEGRLGLNDPVERYLPELAKRQVLVGGTADEPKLEPAKRPMTIRHLLTHTAGLYYDFSVGEPLRTLWQRADLFQSATSRDAVRRVATLPLAHQPGDRWTYGLGTDVLGAVIEVVTGQDLETAMRERVLGPLGMKATTFFPGPELQARLATIHHRTKTGGLEKDEEWTRKGTLAFPSGGGGLFSTAADYARFAQMLLNQGELDGVRVLGRKSVELMLGNQSGLLGTAAGPAPHMGLGVSVRREDNQPWSSLGSPGSFGWTGAATTSVVIDPQERMVLLVLLQHMPHNQDGIFDTFANTVYQALK